MSARRDAEYHEERALGVDVSFRTKTRAEAYQRARAFRQAQDDQWVLDAVPEHAETLLDVGCGTGEFLRAALTFRPRIRHGIGLDASPASLRAAARTLSCFRPRVELLHNELTSCGPIARSFDVITMMSVLHWLHPQEEQVFAWAARGLTPTGRLVVTTYHPECDSDGFGGTDCVVREAMLRLGLDRRRVTVLFDSAGVVPMGTRTLPESRVRSLLQRYFGKVETDIRTAVMQVDDEAAYHAYHLGTFGTYYAQLLPEQQPGFYHQLGRTAMSRMRDRGYVTKMAVRRWICSQRVGTRRATS